MKNDALQLNALLNDSAVWMIPTPEIEALHERKIVLQRSKSKRRGYLHVCQADPAGADAGKCALALDEAWIEGGKVWADDRTAIPTGQTRSRRRYLTPDALPLIGENSSGPKALKLCLPPE
jgi:hypothetical protein